MSNDMICLVVAMCCNWSTAIGGLGGGCCTCGGVLGSGSVGVTKHSRGVTSGRLVQLQWRHSANWLTLA